MKKQILEKACNRCGETKPIKMFPICDYRKGVTRYRADCKECYNEKARRGRPRKIVCQINEDERICTRCSTVKPNEEFSNLGRDNWNNVVYKNGVCKDCYRNNNLQNKYGITSSEYDAVLAKQGGLCAICNRTNASKRALAVDHNHITGAVRGLLCTNCNFGLGNFKADRGTDILKAAIAYLS